MATTLNSSVPFKLVFSGTLGQSITGAISAASIDSNSINPSTSVSLDPGTVFTNGTGVCQANKWYLAYRTLTATTNDDLDLAGSLTDPFGNTLTFTAIKSIFVAIDYAGATYDGTKTLEIGPGSASNTFSGPFGGTNGKFTFDKAFGAFIGTAAGWTVTASTGDILRVRNPGASSVSYLIWIQGI